MNPVKAAIRAARFYVDQLRNPPDHGDESSRPGAIESQWVGIDHVAVDEYELEHS